MIQIILSILSGIISAYIIICLVHVVISWIPGARFTKFGRIISKISEPYMGIFRKMTFLTITHIDFSPIVSIGILSLISSILAGIQIKERIYFGAVLGTILTSLWGITVTIICIFTLLIFIRWIFLALNHGKTNYDSGWNQVDILLTKITFPLAGTIAKKRIDYQTSLLISWIMLLIFLISGYFIIGNLAKMCYKIPF